MELGGSLPRLQNSTTCPYRSQINPFLCPSHFWQAQLFSFLVGLRTCQHPRYKRTYVNSLFLAVNEGGPVWVRTFHHSVWETWLERPYGRSGLIYKGADKSLARPGRKQLNVSVRMAWISFGALPCRKKKTWWQLASPCCWNRTRPWHVSELVSFLVGLRTYQHPGTIKCNSKVWFEDMNRVELAQNKLHCNIFIIVAWKSAIS